MTTGFLYPTGSPCDEYTFTSRPQVGGPEPWPWKARRARVYGLKVRDHGEERSMPDERAHGERVKTTLQRKALDPLVRGQENVDQRTKVTVLRQLAGLLGEPL